MFCTQLDRAAAGTKLGGQLQARCRFTRYYHLSWRTRAFSQIVFDERLIFFPFLIGPLSGPLSGPQSGPGSGARRGGRVQR